MVAESKSRKHKLMNWNWCPIPKNVWFSAKSSVDAKPYLEAMKGGQWMGEEEVCVWIDKVSSSLLGWVHVDGIGRQGRKGPTGPERRTCFGNSPRPRGKEKPQVSTRSSSPFSWMVFRHLHVFVLCIVFLKKTSAGFLSRNNHIYLNATPQFPTSVSGLLI